MQRANRGLVNELRQALIAEILAVSPDDQLLMREAVEQLIDTLIAARKSGMSFEKMAEIFERKGLALSPATLRTYFFDVKSEAELKKTRRQHADKLYQLRQNVEKQRLEQAVAQGTQAALALAGQLTQAPVAETPPAAPPVVAVRTPPPVRAGAPRPDAPAVAQPPRVGAVAAPTLVQMEAQCAGSDVRTVLPEDVVLRDGRIYYASGRPFDGVLSKKQILLLREAGRVVAPAGNKSSQDFVGMPKTL